MLRITSHEVDDELVITLEGCLDGPWVTELAACWIHAAEAHPEQPVRVDLADVCHVDRAGRALMTLMYRAGVRFAASGCFMPELVREIAATADRNRRN